MNGLSANDGEEGCGASRGIDCPRGQHGHDGRGNAQRRSNLDCRTEQLVTGHADECGYDMASDQIPRLRPRTSDSAVHKHGGRPERTYQQRKVVRLEKPRRKVAARADSSDGPIHDQMSSETPTLGGAVAPALILAR